jgi:hypothetical protein
MIITNALLSIGFGLITNFCTLLPANDVYAPKSSTELRDCVIGSPNSPVDLHVAVPRGASFGIRDGAVYYFSTPESFFRQGDPSQLGKYAGTSVLGSDQVMLLVSNTLHRLLKTNASLANGKPKLRQGGVYKGKEIPFFQVEWPAITPGSHVNGADIEIDARTGRVVFLHLLDDAFFDQSANEQIIRLVSEPKREDKPRTTPKPENDRGP